MKGEPKLVEGELWESTRVTRRSEPGRVVLYRCSRRLSDGRYCVQSADTLYEPIDRAQIEASENQWWELLAEQDPGERSGTFPTLADAIAAFDSDVDE